jgi:transposase
MFQSDLSVQPSLFAFSHRDLVSEDSDVWLYVDLFDALDFLDFDSNYSSQGQEAKDPRLMLRTIFYALTHGVTSGRKLQDACRNDNRFIVLSGDRRPDRRTFDRFLERHGKQLDKFFVTIVRLAQKAGLVKLGRVAIDGSKFKSNADRSMKYESMERALGYIREELTTLKEDLKNANAQEATELEDRLDAEIRQKELRRDKIKRAKEQIEKEFAQSNAAKSKKEKRLSTAAKALHDPEALALGASADFSFGYNCQAAVDAESQIVVACEIHDCASDQQALKPTLAQVKENCGGIPEKILADSGYRSVENLEHCIEQGVDPIFCFGEVESGTVATSANEQVFQGLGDREYHCLHGKELKLLARSNRRLIFRMNPEFCQGCPFQSTCKLFGRTRPEVWEDRIRVMLTHALARSRGEEFIEIYKRRKAIVEPVFGNIKNKSIRIFVRGKKKVRIWWKMACTAHNLEKIVGRLRTHHLKTVCMIKNTYWALTKINFKEAFA